MTVRMQDIATDLKLSKMTISKVLRGQMDVSAATKARVLQRIQELNYRPNISARSLKTGRTMNIGLVLPSLTDTQSMAMARSLVQHLRLARYSVSLSSAEFEPELERREIEQQLSLQVDALILASIQTPVALIKLNRDIQTPLIHLHARPHLFKSNSVDLDGREVGYLAASHLVRVGCRRIAIVRGLNNSLSALSYKGFLAALAEAGLRSLPTWTIVAEDTSIPDYERGTLAAQQLLRAKLRPDGIVCDSDLTAAGVMDVLSGVGISIPSDVAIIGCGNDLRLCEMRIPLSSVDLSPGTVGQQAAKLTLKLLAKDKPPKVKSVLVPPSLVVRTSTARMG